MTTSVIINNLAVRAYHGVLPEERRLGNDFVVSAVLRYPFLVAFTTDDISDTLNYAVACDIITQQMAIPSALLEHVAGRIIKALHKRFPLMQGGELTITKVNPPIEHHTQGTSVRVEWNSTELVW